jgi:cell wall-associated NlpC family hydrolase
VDGRKFCARSGAAIATILTIAGLELAGAGTATAAPAPRSDDHKVAAARALADHLAAQADTAGARHERVQRSLDRARTRLQGLDRSIVHQRRTEQALKAEVAGLAGSDDDAGFDPADGTYGAPPPQPTTPGSSTLLTNVVVVSQDTDGLAQRLTASDSTLVSLTQRRAALGRQVGTMRRQEHSLAASASRLQHRADDAQARVTNLIGGPAVAYALSKVGNGYVFGAAGPTVFDCSGLTMAAWAQAGIALPHSSSAQYATGRHISESELQPGDLVFYYSPISHVGMYIGNGKIVNALNPGAGVVISGLHDMPYAGAVRPG